MRSIIKDKRGSYADLFLFMILAVCIVFISVVMIKIVGEANTKFHEELDDEMFGATNGSELVTETIGAVSGSYNNLYWISVMLIVGMIISIFMGSYMVTTRPVFFVPYLFIVIIAIIVSVGIANAYEEVMVDPTLSSTFDGFTGANFLLGNLPMIIAIVGIMGGIIMFSRIGSKENEGGYYG